MKVPHPCSVVFIHFGRQIPCAQSFSSSLWIFGGWTWKHGTLLAWNSCCLVGYLIAQEGEERRRSSSIGAMGRKSDLEEA